MLALIAAMLATAADVLARKLFGYTYSGTIDLVQLLVLSGAFLAIPYTFAARGHVAVAIVASYLSTRSLALLDAAAAALASVLMALFAWYGWGQAALQVEYGDVSQTIGIPMIWYWIPLVYGCLLSALITLTMMLGGGRSPLPTDSSG